MTKKEAKQEARDLIWDKLIKKFKVTMKRCDNSYQLTYQWQDKPPIHKEFVFETKPKEKNND